MLKTTDYISKKYADTPPEFDPETDYVTGQWRYGDDPQADMHVRDWYALGQNAVPRQMSVWRGDGPDPRFLARQTAMQNAAYLIDHARQQNITIYDG